MPSEIERMPSNAYDTPDGRLVLRAVQHDIQKANTANRKSSTKGLLNISLMACNTAQLKQIWTLGHQGHKYFKPLIALLPISILLQIIIALIFVKLSHDEPATQLGEPAAQLGEPAEKSEQAKRQKTKLILTNFIKLLVIIVTIGNIFITSFSFVK